MFHTTRRAIGAPQGTLGCGQPDFLLFSQGTLLPYHWGFDSSFSACKASLELNPHLIQEDQPRAEDSPYD